VQFATRETAGALRVDAITEGSGMTWKAGPLVLAIASVAVRLAGDHGVADMLAVAYLATVTLHLHRSTELRAVAVRVRS
jgi:hypothetical protein